MYNLDEFKNQTLVTIQSILIVQYNILFLLIFSTVLYMPLIFFWESTVNNLQTYAPKNYY